MERSSLEMRDDDWHFGMKIRDPDRFGYNSSYERLETYRAIL